MSLKGGGVGGDKNPQPQQSQETLVLPGQVVSEDTCEHDAEAAVTPAKIVSAQKTPAQSATAVPVHTLQLAQHFKQNIVGISEHDTFNEEIQQLTLKYQEELKKLNDLHIKYADQIANENAELELAKGNARKLHDFELQYKDKRAARETELKPQQEIVDKLGIELSIKKLEHTLSYFEGRVAELNQKLAKPQSPEDKEQLEQIKRERDAELKKQEELRQKGLPLDEVRRQMSALETAFDKNEIDRKRREREITSHRTGMEAESEKT